jgi:uncharacterized protein YdaU (DUF1376 family)
MVNASQEDIPMRKPDIWMPVFIGDHLAETMDFTARQHGAYLLLQMAAWKAGGTLDDDDARLARMAGLSPDEWREDRPRLAALFEIADGKWRHQRLMAELEGAANNKQKRSKAGGKGAAKRWQKNSPSPSPSPSPHSEANASGSDTAAVVFNQGLEWLQRSSAKPPTHCRALLGKWRKELGSDEALISLLGRAQREGVIEPVGWIEKAIAVHRGQLARPAASTGWNG